VGGSLGGRVISPPPPPGLLSSVGEVHGVAGESTHHKWIRRGGSRCTCGWCGDGQWRSDATDVHVNVGGGTTDGEGSSTRR
jgi:hypothetical protein